MAGVTAAQVKALRDRTGAGMMDCKKALVEAGGDLDAAVEAMRVSGLAAADRKAGRIAAEGVVAVASEGARGAMVEVNCETDFVAREDDFGTFAGEIARLVLANDPDGPEALGALPLDDGTTVDERRRELVARIGENIAVRRFEVLDAGKGHVAGYVHIGRIGVLVAVEAGDEPAATGKDIAMHVAASRPLAVSESDLPADLVERERAIIEAQAAESGKPAAIMEKIVHGRLRKFASESTLLGQPFVKDPDVTVAGYLAGRGAEVRGFVRFEVGEGIERKEDDFVSEVMAQVRKNA
ncbi:MAG: translation elongation factor Ts [Immundisolibacterales bacterium]|nr:translation elongation factor Ts [Immundisolibacterales bacterium]